MGASERKKIKIGVLGFSDGDTDVHNMLKRVVQTQLDTIVTALENTGIVDVVKGEKIINSVKTAKDESKRMLGEDVDATIFSYGVFSFPNFSAIAAQQCKGPFLLAANLNPEWPGMVAMLAAGGALNHLGIRHWRLAGDFSDKSILDRAINFCRCAYVKESLNGAKYGIIGGRSLGMYSTTVDMQQWQKLFGVDIEHIDQSEILRLADKVSSKQIEKAFSWLNENIGEIKFDKKQLTPEKLKKQISHYEATKKLIKDHQLDFISVKCHYDMSKNYCTQCLTAAFCNDPYDWDGAKEPVVMACEADSDAALTMQILKKLSNNGPVIFMDIRHYDKECDVMVFCNCGSQATYFAGCSDNHKENLSKVTLYPALDIYHGGGAHVNLMNKAGTVTIARLHRKDGKYRMTIVPCEFVELPPEKMAETTREWPHSFAKLKCDYEDILQSFDANHCHAVYGDYVEDLITVAEMLNIKWELL